MKLNRLLMMTAAASVMVAHMAVAQSSIDSLIAAYEADGFSSIEVQIGLTQVKIEGVKDGTKIEVVYDKETGALLSQETQPATESDLHSSAEVKRTNDDFYDDGEDDDHSGSEDDDEEDDDDGHHKSSSSHDDDDDDDHDSHDDDDD